MSNVVPFPRPDLPSENAPIRVTASGEGLVVRCNGLVHVFGEVPGRCQCGSEWWDGNPGEGAA